ncbi:LADA_0D01310g1_1 [Lachancea dasiensis]|uniref:LADA_0D01310g1_1 n=1 Tax=Lachancea dasiensis TaxID=1072105 RepID=A0A1G4J4B5_9SACH|nr:LADA_0D01310g1_1 [Lachancea dasiensis]
MIDNTGVREEASHLERTPKQERAQRSSLAGEDEVFQTVSPRSPQTPSPPTNTGDSIKLRRSSVSHGFLASPLPGSNPKRHSGSDFAIQESPGMRTRLLPPTTPKTRNAEMFLSPSPKLKSPGVQKDTERPIRELSSNLKTRLNYAFVKLQNGWVDKSLNELEPGIDLAGTAPALSLQNTTYSNRLLEDEDSGNNSAHAAFMHALTSPRKQKRRTSSAISGSGPRLGPKAWNGSPRRAPVPPPIHTNVVDQPKSRSKDQPSEVEAIETLMSLSSPKKPSHRKSRESSLPDPPPPLSLPRNSPVQLDQTVMALSSRSSSSTSSVPNTLAKPFLLKNEVGPGPGHQVLLDVETDVEESNGD